ncbi:conserved hypothetical protein [Magnetospirillum sp. LM-5]|nr:conserved hypothetical protein [Magnetospirillum sp. LM-5]
MAPGCRAPRSAAAIPAAWSSRIRAQTQSHGERHLASLVIPALDAGIHAVLPGALFPTPFLRIDVDGRAKPGHDERGRLSGPGHGPHSCN